VHHVTPALSCREAHAVAQRDLLSPATMPLNVLKMSALALTAKASWETSVRLMERRVVNHVITALSCSMGHASAQKGHFSSATPPPNVPRTHACAITAWSPLEHPAA